MIPKNGYVLDRILFSGPQLLLGHICKKDSAYVLPLRTQNMKDLAFGAQGNKQTKMCKYIRVRKKK